MARIARKKILPKTTRKKNTIKENLDVEEIFTDEELGRPPKKQKVKEVTTLCKRCGKDCIAEYGRYFINDIRYCKNCYEIENREMAKKMMELLESKRGVKRW